VRAGEEHQICNTSAKPPNKPKASHPTTTTTSVTSATFTPRLNNFAKQKPAYVNRNRSNSGTAQGPLTDAKIQQQKNAKLCLYYGEGEYIANNCPLAQACNATTHVSLGYFD